VNQTLANRFWPAQDPIGRRIEDVGPERASIEVVGVVGDVRATFDEPSKPTLHAPLAQFYEAFPWQPLPTLIVRTQGEPLWFVPTVAAAVQRLDPDLPLFRVRTLREQVSTALAQQRFLASLLSAFGALAVVLAAAGLYGLVSYTTQTRMREFGVRSALGARASDVLRLVLADGARLALVGLALGLGAALALRGVLAGLIFGVGTADPLSMGAVALLLLLVALAAALGPARRAARVDPMTILRRE
jgi:predicted lysophospholipase L1 biosynthesis ABC-type transport system permease subunit